MKRILPLSVLLAVTACRKDPAGSTPTPDSQDPGLDVSVRLSAGEVRAGVVRDGAALFGGSSAEGQEGDFKIYNDRVQFIVQGIRDSSYYESYGGGLIDMDIVRPQGQPGRDVVDELSVMVGLGRLVSPDSIDVIADGSDGQAAVVRVTGHGAPMMLLTGALEAPGFVPEREVTIITDYTLRPDSYLLEAHTEVQWLDQSTAVQIGDLSMIGMEVLDNVQPGRGLEGGSQPTTGEWLGVMGRQNEVAVAILSDDEAFSQGAIGTLLSEIGPVLAALSPSRTLADGDQSTWTRFIGVGPDLATLTGAWHAARGDSTTAVGGQVSSDEGPVAGARVHLLDGAALETIAVTDGDGRWTADVAASSPRAQATGRGHAEVVDLPPGAGWASPYAHADVAADVLTSLSSGALPIPFAEAYGLSEEVAAGADTALSLVAPGWLSVVIEDGGPAIVRADFGDGDVVSADGARVPGRPSGAMAFGYVRDGALDLPLEPGSYRITVHRGPRYEAAQFDVDIESGLHAAISADLALSLAPSGFLALDPHSHAAPSGDGGISMADRLLVMAGNGVQVHFGTDHDHVADYRPLLAPLGIDGLLNSVVADEVSPVLRGHTNVYPLEVAPDRANHGAPRWWEGIVDTDSYYADLRAWAGPDAIIQVNHPDGSKGMLGNANYEVGTGNVGKPDFFSTAFDAMEVLNDGDYADYVPYYLDLVNRGYDPIPTGVSDSHGYRNGVGENMTWLPLELGSGGTLDPAALSRAMRQGGTIVSRGPFLDVRVGGAWAPGQTFDGALSLDVDVISASWVQVDTVDLLENGVVVDSRPWVGDAMSFQLSPAADAVYVVMAHGSTPMAPVYPGQTPWAMSAAIKVDRAGDGWTPPLPDITLGD